MAGKDGKRTDGAGAWPAIARRDFIGGIAAGATLGATLSATGAAAQSSTGQPAQAVPAADVYPPVRTGLRGQYPGSFEAAHAARDGDFTGPVSAEDSGEHYDLVIVGGGISGLSAAHFYRKAMGDDRKILILDNHDDFGGHAKRNEFHHEGRTILSYGGTMSIETPFPYSYVSKSLLADIGVVPSTYERYDRRDTYKGLGRGVFFDRENFGRDRLVPGMGKRPWDQFFADAPLAPKLREAMTRLYTAKTEYLPGMDPVARAQALKAMSYQDFLLKHVGLPRECLPYFAGMGYRNNMRVDSCPAFTAWRNGAPGFAGMDIAKQISGDAEHFHFPDGNASIARLLVAKLVPGVFPPGQTQESIVLAPCTYAALDVPANPTRVRLGSMVIRAEHLDGVKPTTDQAVRVVYVKDGRRVSVTGANVILACFNNIIPFIAPELPDPQKEALRYASKVPMLYTNVLIRNWHAWTALGVSSIYAPNGYHPNVSLDIPLEIGGYRSAATPDQAVVVHMVRNPNQPGLPRRDQNRAGRMEMLETPFETIEKEIRDQLDRMLRPGGFRSDRDILAITANRWPHGYAYTYDTLGDPEMADSDRPHVIGRKPFGRIAIANCDSGASAFTNVAIDQADRAVQEILISRGLT